MADYTFTAPDGSVWASRHEYEVYAALYQIGAPVVKCEKGSAHTMGYTESKRGLRCRECGSSKCVQERTYTPDLLVAADGRDLDAGPAGQNYYIEAKGYFRESARGLFRHFRRSNPEIDVRLVLMANHAAGKRPKRILDWAKSPAKVEAWVWNYKTDDPTDVIPEEWMIWL
jgi:hypothetical protein